MGFKFKTGGPKPVMVELKSLLESNEKGPKKLLGMSYRVVYVGISDLDPGSFKHQCYLQYTPGKNWRVPVLCPGGLQRCPRPDTAS